MKIIDYNKIYNDLLQVVPNGNTVMKVMNVLKANGIIISKFTKDIEWIFNFQRGGWNTVKAKNLEDAKAKNLEDAKAIVKIKYGEGDPLYDSVRPSTKTEYEYYSTKNFD